MYVVACTLWRRCDASARKTQELPRLRTAIFAEEYNCKRNPVRHGLMRVMLFTMVILQHALIARASLLTDFCLTMDAIRLPDEKEQWDADGFPQFITLELTNWKGNTKRRKQVRARGGAAPRRSTGARQRLRGVAWHAAPRVARFPRRCAPAFQRAPAVLARAAASLTPGTAPVDCLHRAQRHQPAVLPRGCADVLAARAA